MKQLFYKPFWIGNPNPAILINEMENELQKGNDVIVIGCNGELINGCIHNPIRSKLTCNSCKYFRKKDLSLLSKKVKVHSIVDFINDKDYRLKKEWKYSNAEDIKQIKYKGVDLGSSALSAYIQLTRNQSPKITKRFKEYFDEFLNAGALITDAFLNAVDEIKPDTVGIFNGRIHTRRPILNICQQKGIECNVYEHTGFLGENECKQLVFKNCLPQDTDFITKTIYQTWDEADLPEEKKIEIGTEFYEKKRKGKNVDDRSYIKKQIENLLPKDWDSSKRNITIFNSSDDEFASLGEEWEYKLSESRLKTIIELLEHFKDNANIYFYLRVHPNLTNVKYKYVTDLQILKAFKNLTIIPPESTISSYSLLDASEKIITFGSTVGVEAVYAKKPSILLNTSLYVGLNITYFPNNHSELFKMIDDYLKPKDILPALKYAFYRLYQGKKFKYFEPNPYIKREFYFKDKIFFSLNKNYREKMYNGFWPSMVNFLKYKQHSLPKNFMLRINKNFIPSDD